MKASVLRIRDENGNVADILTIKGKTPKKGVDYFTEEDKAEIAQSVMKKLPEMELSDMAAPLIERTVTKIQSPVKQVGKSAFASCTELVSAEFFNAESVNSVAFSKCSALASVSFPLAKTFGTQAFSGCESLTKAVFPSAESVGYWMFQKCYALVLADFPVATSVAVKAFDECYALKALCLRNTETVCTLVNVNAFDTSGIPTDGYIYVPAALVDSYKAAEKWSTYAERFRALEEWTVDGTVTGALKAECLADAEV